MEDDLGGEVGSTIVNVITTADKRDVIENIGRAIVEKRLAACCQAIGPIKSVYWWKGRLEEAEEWIGVMKTRDDLWQRVEEEIRKLHPYEVPQIESIEARGVSQAYAQWVFDETLSA
jgi:periplasmic divalent cation tolerance protein